jgi:phospholipase C
MGEGPSTGPVGDRRKRRSLRPYVTVLAISAIGASAAVGATVASASTSARATAASAAAPAAAQASSYQVIAPTSTPIKHVVVLFNENVSFDHYFGTYPYAANSGGSAFHAKPGTPKVNGLYTSIGASGPTGPLLTANPNSYNPQRLTPSQALTCDQNHGYTAEQQAFDGGKMDKFVQYADTSTCGGQPTIFGQPGLVMDYYDGNTVTGLWNYAQNYAMSQNNYGTVFGPSTPGALNLISGNTAGYAVDPVTGAKVSDPGGVSSLNSNGVGAIYGDPDPAYDDCSNGSHTSSHPLAVATGPNVGDLLNARHVTWGWFQGGFAPTGTNSAGYAVCGSSHKNIGGFTVQDYSPHHEPFQYYKSTANPKHLPPASEAAIGHTDQANHQYDLSAFDTALKDGNMPAVSFLKASEYQDGHPGYSDPIDEQHFIVNTVNQIEQSKFWKSTAIIVTYDDSDGWYDHQNSPRANGSNDPATDQAVCTSTPIRLGTLADRCGYGPRLPLVVISPYTRQNHVSKNLTDQSSITKFIEGNWLHGQSTGSGSYDAVAGSLSAPGGVLDFRTQPHFSPVILDATTGEVVSKGTRR